MTPVGASRSSTSAYACGDAAARPGDRHRSDPGHAAGKDPGARFPGEIYRAPRSWAERSYRKLICWNEVDKGGHFATWVEPKLFATSEQRSDHSGNDAGPSVLSSLRPAQKGKLQKSNPPSSTHVGRANEQRANPSTMGDRSLERNLQRIGLREHRHPSARRRITAVPTLGPEQCLSMLPEAALG